MHEVDKLTVDTVNVRATYEDNKDIGELILSSIQTQIPTSVNYLHL